MGKLYVTTPIYYINSKPHIGHAYTSVICDAFARFARMVGQEVFFSTGVDEHGIKIDRTAKEKGMQPQEYADSILPAFQSLIDRLNCSADAFVRTTDDDHKRNVVKIWQILKEKGFIYEGSYKGWYSVRDEAFFNESELVDGMAPTGAPVEWQEESTYFFALSKFQDKLLQFYDDNPDFIYPKSRMNEVKAFVQQGLTDLSVSRSTMSWGVPVEPGHVTYVWLDALTNYLTVLGWADGDNKYEKFWHADDRNVVHVIGKDILRFHAIYWPAFLMAADLPLPSKIVSHGWWTVEGNKISKSLGNAIDPQELIDEFGEDFVRYFLLREISLGSDGNYSKESFVHRVNSELADNIGNLTQRIFSMIVRNCGSVVPQVSFDDRQRELMRLGIATISDIQNFMSEFKLNEAIGAIVSLSSAVNGYINDMEPWAMAKQGKIDELRGVLRVSAELIVLIAMLLRPFIPDAAKKIMNIANVDAENSLSSFVEGGFMGGVTINSPFPVFAKIRL